jgi:hypothetical protein
MNVPLFVLTRAGGTPLRHLLLYHFSAEIRKSLLFHNEEITSLTLSPPRGACFIIMMRIRNQYDTSSTR